MSMVVQADSKDSGQTGQLPTGNRVFARLSCHFVGFVMKQLRNILASCLPTSVSLFYTNISQKDNVVD